MIKYQSNFDNVGTKIHFKGPSNSICRKTKLHRRKVEHYSLPSKNKLDYLRNTNHVYTFTHVFYVTQPTNKQLFDLILNYLILKDKVVHYKYTVLKISGFCNSVQELLFISESSNDAKFGLVSFK